VAERSDYESRKIKSQIRPFRLHVETPESVSVLIRNPGSCAVGERVCASLSRGSPVTESVFLYELAAEMVRSGQARFVDGDTAIAVLEKYPVHPPLVVAHISGKAQEICRSDPEDCIFWNLKKRGIDPRFRRVL
jgi:hypothetical protein